MHIITMDYNRHLNFAEKSHHIYFYIALYTVQQLHGNKQENSVNVAKLFKLQNSAVKELYRRQ